MNLHEFQAKELLAQFGVPIPRGRIAASPAEAASVARRLGFEPCVIKAQVHAGDRAANGGIRFASSVDEAGRMAGELIGSPLVTAQTGPAGKLVRWVYVEEAVAFKRELYVAVVVDRTAGALVLVTRDRDAGPDAGMTTRLELSEAGVRGDFEKAAAAFRLEPSLTSLLAKRMSQIAQAAVALDAMLVEISPLVLTHSGEFIALDAKMSADHNAL